MKLYSHVMVVDKNSEYFQEDGTLMDIREDLRTGVKTAEVLKERFTFGQKETKTFFVNYNQLKEI